MSEEREIGGVMYTEFSEGTIQCYKDGCGYWGTMEGFVKADDNKYIFFVCPECEAVERVVNPFGG